jgi:hypothetical protein
MYDIKKKTRVSAFGIGETVGRRVARVLPKRPGGWGARGG